ncbi:hypothetical protein [Solemya velesiana gill symbiont]|uniref:Phosphatase n=1 Tax=Solemya velesiana gill symbiont TaxID=1918948 RepID=A0A1T2KUB6_9GAMM|nr:hypothetical protein [Solemya velesiana gill symbiont]OOZ36458.1 hypothetical protein BOW51_07015 [Solemya velesiana gill symbiont]
MTHHFIKNAESVVDGFRSMLDDDVLNAVGEENLGQLQVLIESAITTVVLESMEQVADKIEALGHQVRHDAETYDDNQDLV